MALTLMVDIGNFGTRVVYKHKGEMVVDSFSSVTALYKDLEDQKKMVDVFFEEGHYITGEGAEFFFKGEKEKFKYAGGKSKGHSQGAVRLIHALYRVYNATNESKFNILILSPFESTKKDKIFFQKHFSESNTYMVNSRAFNFDVEHIGTIPEGLGAFRYAKSSNCILFDAGSGTCNITSIINGTVNLDDTHTVNGGTVGNSPFELVFNFKNLMKDVNSEDEIVVSGGKAREIARNLEAQGYENVILPEIEKDEHHLINLLGIFELQYDNLSKEWD